MSHSGPKELLEILPLKGQTRGEDIAIAVIECMDKHHISLDKIESISTDGAKKALCRQTFPDEICKVMQLGIAIINSILAKALNHRQFKEFSFEMESESADLLLRNKVRCDEAHFWLNGYVNKQNCRIWSEANPQVYVETPLHLEKLTIWCALWADGIIGPYFFKNDEGHNVTVNGDRYRAMIANFFIPELNNHDVQELWFQQDGATCHTARATIDLLKDTFGDRLISRF
ncbi:transposable element Tc3 transposase [Trichonephila clavipes]|nr:transposable element Tc3 transposase [Trichonephila clavipes]